MMKNKVELKKYLIISVLTIICFEICFLILWNLQYKKYTQNVNYAINGIINEIICEYPNVDKNEIARILNQEESDANNDVLKEYGIDIKSDTIILKNDIEYKKCMRLNLIITSISFVVLVIIFIGFNKKKDKKIAEITNYIEEINRKNYSLKIQNNTEDELSILQNELYKTTIMLKEQAENSIEDKLNLKDSLANISHQLKTPLTSISIMLDNILDDENMPKEVRNEFIKDIRNEISNISLLINAILKLSKLDTNTIVLNRKEENLAQIIRECERNLLPICDLKNVSIQTKILDDARIICDKSWYKEAITNILKNCVEHSHDGGTVEVLVENSKIYTKIKITDKGTGISSKDLPHIFERFYKGENATSSSIGIGLALSKTIIEKEGGFISVSSEEGKGSTFEIKMIA